MRRAPLCGAGARTSVQRGSLNSLLLDSDRREHVLDAALREPEEAKREPIVERAVEKPGFVDVVSACGAVLVVGIGLAFVFVTSIVALATVPADQKAAIVTAAFTVFGTIVGAYFGVKVGAAGKEKAEQARDAEAAKAQEFAAHLEPETATAALDRVQRRLEPAKR